jgi:acyl carrier protein
VVEPVAAAPVVEPVAAAPVVEPVAATPVVEPVAATPVVEPAEMQSKLLAVVSDKTGYPVEMLELDMDMEADLGIDSIKRVEILGALQEQFPGMPQPNLEEMAEIELRTLGQVADFMQTLLAAPAAAAPVVPATPTSEPAVLPTPAVVAPVAAAVTAVQETPAAAPVVTATAVLERPVTITAPTVDPAEMQSKLLAVVSDKTGYPVEMLELDMDIEADLGIDSIKRVEILGALQEQFPGMPQPNLEEMAEIELRTLGQVADFMQSLLAAPEKKNDSGELGNFSLELETLPLPRSQAQLKFLPSPDWLEFEIPQGHTCVLTDDGSAVTAQLAQRLLDQGAKVVVLSFPKTLVPQSTALPQGVQQVMLEDFSDDALEKTLDQIATREGSPAVFIHLHPAISANASVDSMFSETDAAIVKQVFFMAKHLKQFLTQAATQGRSAFLTVARLDGTFGLSQQNPFNAIPAGLLGLTKTLNYEWPSVYCRALDVSPALSVEQLVDCILAELHDPDQRFAEVAYGVSGRTTLMAA